METAHQIAALAQRAVLYEVTASPKPGLVDRHDAGAHSDMDIFTFMSSSSALYRGFYDCAMAGLSCGREALPRLLGQLRAPGICCEAQMLSATGGVNTHKGAIFSLGIAAAAAGYLSQTVQKPKMEDICKVAAKIGADLVADDFGPLKHRPPKTWGERLYLEMGFTGIRGEVASGFQTLQSEAFEPLRYWGEHRHLPLNDLLVDLLLRIMQRTEDTNLLTRGGIDGLVFAKGQARRFVEAGGMQQPEAMAKLRQMNAVFCEKRLSPGGSADLLAVAVFLAMNEGIL